MPSETFNFTGGWQTWTVPENLYTVGVSLSGGGANSAEGGRVSGQLAVQPGQVLYVLVGRSSRLHSNRAAGDPAFGGGGAGGNGKGSGNGGDSGGGASAIRRGSPTGTILAVAGGAGGRSGDGGDGGKGGHTSGAGHNGTGQSGSRGGSGSGSTVNATGGSQDAAGKGGTSSAGAGLAGDDGGSGKLAEGGRGGSSSADNVHGGGGGGGGYHPGGGGNGGKVGIAPAGGGGGGASYTGDLITGLAVRGGGTTGNGEVVLTWDTPPPPNQPPPPPSDLRVNGIELGSETATRALDQVTITATINNSQNEQAVLVLRISRSWDFSTYITYQEPPIASFAEDLNDHTIVVNGLEPASRYYVRAWSLDKDGYSADHISESGNIAPGYSSGSFWTNRPPDQPELLTPGENTQWLPTDNIVFTWTPLDPDNDDGAPLHQVRYRRAPRPNVPQEGWTELPVITTNSLQMDAGTFRGNTFYLWSVRTADAQGMWSNWSLPNSFYIIADSEPPNLLYPIRGDGVVADDVVLFRWDFNDPTPDATQHSADIRYRIVGTDNWITNYGAPDPGIPGQWREWPIPRGTFIEGYHYEWQARTTNSDLFTSDWSESHDFWAIAAPGQGAYDLPDPALTTVAPALGCGVNRVFVSDRGGQTIRGEITGISQLRYNRKRDDISGCTIFTDGKDCTGLLQMLRTWQYELIVFRDGKRVWEGPIVRIDAEGPQMEIEAKDVLNYLYRRILRQGYNDTYRKVNGVAYGGLSVVTRAKLITMNCLAYDDPNVLKWLTTVDHPDDAKQHRSVPDYSKTGWEEIDDMAAHAGLDYTVVGRRIIFNDTHRPLGRLPEMRDGDFSEPVHVTEYGMQLANHFGVTNNNGVYGVAERGIQRNPDGTFTALYYGWVEQLASPYGEQESGEAETLTAAARESLERNLAEQADRNISSRWPAPVVVRVPDNAQLNPTANITFDQLVPGVWIPVRATGTLREVAQWQKLDSVEVLVSSGAEERITVVLSPAPNSGEDPDAGVAATELA